MDKESTTTPQILIVDQSRVVRWTAAKTLAPDFIVHEADDGRAAWALLQRNPDISLVFTSLQLPQMDGYQLLKAIRTSDDARLNNLPVIAILRQEDDGEVHEQLYNLGTTDFITKPFDSVTLKSRTAAYAGFERRLLSLVEKTERDPLTDLPNERAFLLQGEKQLALALRHRTDLTVALLEPAGLEGPPRKKARPAFERLQIEAAGRISAGLRAEDMAARIGPSRFALLLPLTNRIGARHAVSRICRALNDKLPQPDGLPAVRFRAGLTSLDGQEGIDFERLLAQAQASLDQAKGEPAREDPIDFRAPYHQFEKEQDRQQALSLAADATPLSGPALANIINDIRHGRGAGVGNILLMGAMKAVWPLLAYADTRLNLGMELALKGAEKRLDEALRLASTDAPQRDERQG